MPNRFEKDAYERESFELLGLNQKTHDNLGDTPFYLIFSHAGGDVKQLTRDEAIEKAEELASVNPGRIFIVMKAEHVIYSAAIAVRKRELGTSRTRKRAGR